MTVAEARRDESPATSPRELDPAGMTAVGRVLRDRVRTHANTLLEVSDELAPVVAAVRAAAAGGKRLRAAFCLWGARGAAAGRDVPGAVEAGAALEMFHLAALVHDDVMDHSDERRGVPTVHRTFASRHAEEAGLGDGEDFGVAVAVLAGDLCLTWSDDLLAEAAALATDAAGARAVWTEMRDQVLAGQYLDVLGQTRRTTDPEQAGRVVRFKSAKYTVEHPLLLGGTLAGADETLLTRYSSFGLQVGEAFQLRDDVLGVYGDPGVTGKPAVDDVRQGKRTLLVAWAEEAATPVQRQVLHRRLGDPAADERAVAEVREVLDATGARARVEGRIGDLVARAYDDLGAMRVDERTRGALAALTEACAWRAA